MQLRSAATATARQYREHGDRLLMLAFLQCLLGRVVPPNDRVPKFKNPARHPKGPLKYTTHLGEVPILAFPSQGNISRALCRRPPPPQSARQANVCCGLLKLESMYVLCHSGLLRGCSGAILSFGFHRYCFVNSMATANRIMIKYLILLNICPSPSV